MKARPGWRRLGRLNGSDAGRLAQPVWLCAACRCSHKDRDDKGKLIKPFSCKFCHRTVFDYFDSTSEAGGWNALWQRVKAGEIRNLRRQVTFDLMTIAPNGLACKWGEARLDYAFDELQGDEWVPVVADWKPSEGPSPDSVLKFRCLAAQGIRVRIMTDKGVFDFQ